MVTLSARAASKPSTVIVGLVPDAFDGPSQSRHQALRELSKHTPVLWSAPPPNFRDIPLWRIRSSLVDHRPSCDIREVKFGLFESTFYRPSILRSAATQRYYSLLGKTARRLGEEIVASVWRPEFLHAAIALSPDRIVYHVDDEYSFSTDEPVVSACERAALERADLTIFTSTRLAERKSAHARDFRVIPHGVNVGSFRNSISTNDLLAGVPRPRICYVGQIKKQLDFELLRAVATHDNSWHLVLCGGVAPHPIAMREFDRLRQLPNVHAISKVEHALVPQVMAQCDVGLLPYNVDGYSRNIQPLKLAEYLAAGLPVVSTVVPAVEEVACDVVAVARSQAEFVSAIESYLDLDARFVAEATVRLALTRDWGTILPQLRAAMLGSGGPVGT